MGARRDSCPFRGLDVAGGDCWAEGMGAVGLQLTLGLSGLV